MLNDVLGPHLLLLYPVLLIKLIVYDNELKNLAAGYDKLNKQTDHNSFAVVNSRVAYQFVNLGLNAIFKHEMHETCAPNSEQQSKSNLIQRVNTQDEPRVCN